VVGGDEGHETNPNDAIHHLAPFFSTGFLAGIIWRVDKTGFFVDKKRNSEVESEQASSTLGENRKTPTIDWSCFGKTGFCLTGTYIPPEPRWKRDQTKSGTRSAKTKGGNWITAAKLEVTNTHRRHKIGWVVCAAAYAGQVKKFSPLFLLVSSTGQVSHTLSDPEGPDGWCRGLWGYVEEEGREEEKAASSHCSSVV